MFRVEWTPTALNQLARIWTNADDSTRRIVTLATEEIDELLATGAADAGESRDESIRILFVLPLGVKFHVHEASRTAAVFHVWRIREHGH
jgi:hypothetical protein